MTSSSYIDWSDNIVNSAIKNLTISKKVNRYTRAGYGGRNIFCPKCDKRARVYHFSWSALQCQHCNSMIDKYNWKLR